MEDGAIQSLASFSLDDAGGLLQHICAMPMVDACILSSVSAVSQDVIDALTQKAAHFMELTADTPIPVRNLYKTPETLGKDRLAAVVGAYSLFPGRDILVIDAGTALTFDFVDREGKYHGGSISPGLNMRFRALHEFTKKLPLLSQTDDCEMFGDTTASAITSGVQNGIIFEVESYIHQFVNKFPQLVTILTGGDVNFFVGKIKKYIFAEPNLVFLGLEKIIKLNTYNKIET